RRFQPSFERLLRQLLARPLKQSRPGFLCCESHDGFAGVENSRSAKLCAPYTIRNAVAPSCSISLSRIRLPSFADRRLQYRSIYLEQVWVSPLTVPATNAAFGRMVSARGWKPSGVVQY